MQVMYTSKSSHSVYGWVDRSMCNEYRVAHLEPVFRVLCKHGNAWRVYFSSKRHGGGLEDWRTDSRSADNISVSQSRKYRCRIFLGESEERCAIGLHWARSVLGV